MVDALAAMPSRADLAPNGMVSRLLADGRPLLGASKTVRGLVASLAATTLAAPLFGLPAAQGAGFAMLAMLGIGQAAVYGPARRASAVPPAVATRNV